MADWLDIANTADLEALARSLRDGRLPQPYTPSAVQRAGFHEASAWLAELTDVPPRPLAGMMERLARERRQADDRYASLAQLVWSGASEDEQASRDTAMALREVFGRAEHRVLISTFVIHGGRSLFEPLAARLRQCPGIKVELYVNLLPDEVGADERGAVSRFLDVFTRDHWPMDQPQPEIYYHPDNLKSGGEKVTLHAKCVVVDWRWALVTSANFTEAAQERNIEAGVLLDHPGIARALAGRFTGLREAGRLRRMGGWG
ncbi:MAG: DISARM system phospholipase D-like protein DrmC [Polyangiaceae bacterium]|jgi:phosphatidylserine/phosphatidylglycerophosphate/cardiolipin synthase-like enzyme|nr:DISARM system phospholipase D-like protein DrmC [Polyangiaceae bacterium]